MYQIVQYDSPTDTAGHVIYDPRTGKGVSAGTLTLKENDVDDISLTVNQSSYLFAHARPMQTHFDVLEDGVLIFRGRLLKPTREMTDAGIFSRTYTGESVLAYLIDSIQPYGVYHNVTVESFLGTLLKNHNAVVESYKQIKLGNVTVQDSNNSIYRYTGYDTTFSTISDKLITRLGGYLKLRVESDGLYLDYLAKTGEDHQNDTPIMLGRNLKSASVSVDPTSVITRLWPLGATVETDTDVSTTTDASQPRVEIGTVNGGKAYIDDTALQAEFGIINGTTESDDAKLPANVLANGKAFLASQAAATESWTVSAVELRSNRFESFKVSDRYLFLNSGVAERTLIRVVEKAIDFAKPHASTLTIGSKPKKLTTYQMEAKSLKTENAQLKQTVATLTNAISKAVNDTDDQIDDLQKQINALKVTGSTSDDGTTYDPTGLIIDVSEFQGTIDWSKVTAAGLALAVIEVQRGSSTEDAMYKINIAGAVAAGANYGVYAYFKAISESDAKVEAKNFYDRAQSAIGSLRQPRLYMIDVENNTVTSGTLKAAVSAYMDELNALGVPDSKIVIYVSTSLYGSIDTSRPAALWVPRYGSNDGTVGSSTKPAVAYDLWQYTSMGRVSGITANTVDLSTDPSAKFKPFLTKS